MTLGHEEHNPLHPFTGWLLLAAMCVVIVAWGVFNYLSIPDTPRQFDLGALPDVPGQSIYSNEPTPASQPAPPQVVPLPEGRPYDPAAPGRGQP